MATESYHVSKTVDNRYTQSQARVGGILSGASRRFNARNRHAQVRALRREGYTLRRIAATVGYHLSTVSRILSGTIKTCLTHAETLASGPLKQVLREVTPTPEVQGATSPKPARKPPQKRRKRWNFYRGKWATYFRTKFAPESASDKEQGCSWCFSFWGLPQEVCGCCGLARLILAPGEGY